MFMMDIFHTSVGLFQQKTTYQKVYLHGKYPLNTTKHKKRTKLAKKKTFYAEFFYVLPVHDPCVKHQLGFSASLVSHDS